MITLDVKDALNSARWRNLLEFLNSLGGLKYLVHIVDDEGTKSYTTTCGVPQGYILGLLLRIIMYNGVLTRNLPTGVVSIAFADDIGVTVVAHLCEEVELYATLSPGWRVLLCPSQSIRWK